MRRGRGFPISAQKSIQGMPTIVFGITLRIRSPNELDLNRIDLIPLINRGPGLFQRFNVRTEMRLILILTS